jgi:hypothetical protein
MFHFPIAVGILNMLKKIASKFSIYKMSACTRRKLYKMSACTRRKL